MSKYDFKGISKEQSEKAAKQIKKDIEDRKAREKRKGIKSVK